MAVAFINLQNLADAENFGGVQTKIFVAKHTDIKTWPTLATSRTVPKDNIELTGNFVMNTGKKFTEFYVTTDTGKIESEQVGPKDAKGWKNMLDAKVPGTHEDLLGSLIEMGNTPLLS